jgi:hypothetical protein
VRQTDNQQPTTQNSEAIYNHCIRFTEKKVQYATGSRNVFVHQLACNLNRKGISLNEALSFILTDFGYDEKEVTQTVHSAYGNIHEFGKDEYSKFVNSSGVESSPGEKDSLKIAEFLQAARNV